jgi:hypothetical protein
MKVGDLIDHQYADDQALETLHRAGLHGNEDASVICGCHRIH